MARLLALYSLPRTNPGNRHQYKRQNGPYKLAMVAGTDNKLPFGNISRLLMTWLSTEAVYRAPSRKHALTTCDRFCELYQVRYPKACECLTKGREVLFICAAPIRLNQPSLR